jgi:hypothetical protein
MAYRRCGKQRQSKKTAEVVATVSQKRLSCEPFAYATISCISMGRLLRNASQDTDVDEYGFTLADAFTGRAKVEGGPRGRLNMVDERLSRHILVATRACRVGTSGHSTGS